MVPMILLKIFIINFVNDKLLRSTVLHASDTLTAYTGADILGVTKKCKHKYKLIREKIAYSNTKHGISNMPAICLSCVLRVPIL